MPTSPSDMSTGKPTGDIALYDLAVVGAGPAGLAAAVTAAGHGLTVALVDAAPRPGGQYYRYPAPGLGAARPEALHHDWSAFAALTERLERHRSAGWIRHLAEHHVWTVVPEAAGEAAGEAGAEAEGEAGGEASGEPAAEASGNRRNPWLLHAVTGPDGSGSALVRARALLLATGSHERQLPFPGWTLPGVVGAGGAQAMLKSGLVLPGKRIVVAGSGPLLLTVAASLAAAGARVPLVAEAGDYAAYARHPRSLLTVPGKLAEGAVYGAALLRHGVRLRTRAAVTQVHGSERVEAVTVSRLDREWRPVPGSGRRMVCDALAVGHGLVPQLELATALGCATRRTPDGVAALRVDALQRTTVPGVWAAGEAAGVGGAQLALTEGELAGLTIAAELHREPRLLVGSERLSRRRARLRAFADAMAAAHNPGVGWTDWLRADTEVCRCEEVTTARIREAVTELGAADPRTVKLVTRAGMGWCQGRMCGAAVARLSVPGGAPQFAPERRPLSCPVPLGVLAALPEAPPPEPEPTPPPQH